MNDIYEGAFFGRRKGKTLRPAQAKRMGKLLPRLAVDLHEPAPAPLGRLFSGAVDDITLEIGFGGGEHLVHRAGEAPRTGFIGVEPFVNGMAKALAAIEAAGLENIRLHDDDAIGLLDWLPAASIDRAYLLYPDPWPKKRHWKRRFVGPDNLDRLARALKPGAEFRFASDIDTYVDWTLRHVRAHPAFEWSAECAADWREPWQGWPGTRYEAKAIHEGRRGYYLTFRRF
ncbi:tRNA (guanine-N7-)-methyltransferase [Breoghania corrubedonensis]|uniref:tRNA (guanine-N(7)-)-methyltransferase n=1 Tax=Breoghania corrubedonensis TaxID=665038 RepID=A0A2T5VGY2_9HYPH|nr:tRNA (guanine(46)-N(7))-methyltransferase TrmB [Breoghania corrubedonensis]PTW63009.1 tRNA (guanine-N7-)-methyltransferase [Breoghania corrubedonensis]